MANQLAGPVWKIDASVTSPPFTILGQLGQLGPAYIRSGLVTQCMAMGVVSWTAHDAAEGDQVILTDFAGNEVWRSAVATGADFADQYKFVETTLSVGLILTQMQHGFLTINFR
jgi:hypothetical protein